MKQREPKIWATILLKTLKVLIFSAFTFTAWVMYMLGDRMTAGILLIVISIFILYNKIEKIERGE